MININHKEHHASMAVKGLNVGSTCMKMWKNCLMMMIESLDVIHVENDDEKVYVLGIDSRYMNIEWVMQEMHGADDMK